MMDKLIDQLFAAFLALLLIVISTMFIGGVAFAAWKWNHIPVGCS